MGWRAQEELRSILALPLTSHVTINEVLNLSVHQSCLMEWGK